jgi:hypothetical protein
MGKARIKGETEQKKEREFANEARFFCSPSTTTEKKKTFNLFQKKQKNSPPPQGQVRDGHGLYNDSTSQGTLS